MPDQSTKNQVSKSAVILNVLKGIAMGMGDSVPGVSGGTIAVIAGIYERLINAIKSVNIEAMRLFVSGEFAAFWRHVDGSFLLQLALGILLGLVISASTVLYLLSNHSEPLMGFFIGLVLGSIVYLRDQTNWRNTKNVVAAVVGLMVAVSVSLLPPQSIGTGYLEIYLSGAIAICAMILPGLSGAFILLILGVYEFVLNALIELQLDIVVVFVLGCGSGLMAFSRFLSWLLSKYHEMTYAFILGLLLGSVNVLWPWQMLNEVLIDCDGDLHPLTQTRLSPLSYYESTGAQPELALTLLSLMLGLLLVYCLQYFSKKRSWVQK